MCVCLDIRYCQTAETACCCSCSRFTCISHRCKPVMCVNDNRVKTGSHQKKLLPSAAVNQKHLQTDSGDELITCANWPAADVPTIWLIFPVKQSCLNVCNVYMTENLYIVINWCGMRQKHIKFENIICRESHASDSLCCLIVHKMWTDIVYSVLVKTDFGIKNIKHVFILQ